VPVNIAITQLNIKRSEAVKIAIKAQGFNLFN